MSIAPRPDFASLERYHDGDLSDAERAAVEEGLQAHPDAQADLDDLAAIGDALRSSSDALARDYDPARVWAGVGPRLSVQAQATPDESTSPLERLFAWLTPPRLVPLGAFAVAALAYVAVQTPDPLPVEPAMTPTPAATEPATAKPAPAKPPKKAFAQAPADNSSIVDSVESEDVEVLIGATADESPETVIWTFADSSLETP